MRAEHDVLAQLRRMRKRIHTEDSDTARMIYQGYIEALCWVIE